MIGTITDVSCAAAPQIQITLKAQTIVHASPLQRLHTGGDQIGRREFSREKTRLLRTSRPKRARELSAGVGKEWDGELVSIEFRDNP